MASFYTYLYRDIDGTPIYVGKGRGRRGYLATHHGNRCKKRIL